jgi:simple sugar transport system permease protein
MIGTISSIISQIVLYTTVYALAVLGIVISGRTGVFNIAGEGIMLFAASLGYMSSLSTNSWLVGFLAGAIAGGSLGFLLILIHGKMKVDQFILGISIIILGAALADLLYKVWFGTQLMVRRAPAVPVVSIPVLSKIPIVGGFFNQNVATYFMYVCLFLAYYIFYKTKKGLEIRSIGENPKSADVVGIDVFKYRFLSTIVGAMFLGIAGAYLPLILTGSYSFELTAGRGYMAIGIAIFASWRPQRIFLSSFIFATFEVIAPQLQIFFPSLPYEFFLLLPFAGILVIMAIFRKRIEFPAALGEPYGRE